MMAAAAQVSEQGEKQAPTIRETGLSRIRAAQRLLKTDRRGGFQALNTLFREGVIPAPALDGSYQGELVALDLAPGLTPLVGALLRAWMPWQGKTFQRGVRTGDNLLDRSSWRLAHILWPFYRGYRDVQAKTYRAFEFRTYVGSGLADPDLRVMKIDYDLPGNPSLSIRRVVDELVQVDEGVYLGKAHLRWWWGRRQRVAFFLLREPGI
jgi:hypothetical protein